MRTVILINQKVSHEFFVYPGVLAKFPDRDELVFWFIEDMVDILNHDLGRTAPTPGDVLHIFRIDNNPLRYGFFLKQYIVRSRVLMKCNIYK